MTGWLSTITGMVLIAGVVAGTAAPLVPSGDLPGRERYRFTPSPLDRFMQPARAPSRSCAGLRPTPAIAVAAREASSVLLKSPQTAWPVIAEIIKPAGYG